MADAEAQDQAQKKEARGEAGEGAKGRSDIKAAALFSGGKDSTYSIYKAIQEGYEITCLLSLVSDNAESFMFHTPNIRLVEKLADAMELPLLIYETKGEKEKELIDLEKALVFAKEKRGVTTIIAGAIASDYQYQRVLKLCEKLKLDVFTPIWKIDPETYMNDLIDEGFEIMMIAIAAEGFERHDLGRRIDKKMLQRLKELNEENGVHLAGEGGEYETLVLDAPFYKKRVIVKKAEIKMEGPGTGLFLIKRVELEKKKK